MLKNKKLIPLILLCLPLALLFASAACQKSKLPEDVSHYTCPMHPQIKQDQPGQCPICGMDLVPVKKEVEGAEGHEEHDHGDAKNQAPQGIRIDPARTQQIGVQTEAIKTQELNRSFLIQGKVAHDPKLWVAQKEYLVALKLGDQSLIRSSEDKLYFLGLSKEWIRLLKKRRRADLGLHLPTPKGPTFFEAFLYQGDVEVLKPGVELEIYDLQSRLIAEGSIRALGTMVDMETQTVRALIQSHRSLKLKSNTLVQFKVTLPLGKALAIPKRAILFNGDHNMVYVETAPGKFVGRRIQLGKEAGEYFEVAEGLKAGEKVVTNGHFLLDSETQIQLGGQSGGHQH